MDKLVRRVTENKNSNNNVIALSLLTNPKLSNEDILFMMMEFLFGGVDTVRFIFSRMHKFRFTEPVRRLYKQIELSH